MFRLATILLTSLLVFPAEDMVAQDSPEDEEFETQILQGDIHAGIDQLGRVLIAFDRQPTDGVVDRYFQFVAPEPLDGPKSFPIVAGSIERRYGSIVVLAADKSFMMALTVSGFPALEGIPRLAESFDQALVIGNGHEMKATSRGHQAGAMLIENVSHFALDTWPWGIPPSTSDPGTD